MSNMRMTRILLGLLLAAAFTLGAAFSQEARAAEYKPKAKVKTLVDKPLIGVADKTVIIKHFTVPPGFVGGKHFHPGPVFVYVLEGKLTVWTEKRTVTISEGELYQEVPNQVMRGKNVSASQSTKFIVFQVGETGKPMMVKAK
jgi:quercetin dioxygenase-like cupin family protein